MQLNFVLSVETKSVHLKSVMQRNVIMRVLFVFVGAILACATTCRCQGIEFVAINRENIYEYVGSVSVNAQTPWDDQTGGKSPQQAGWTIRGTVKLQRTNDQTLSASVREFDSKIAFVCGNVQNYHFMEL